MVDQLRSFASGSLRVWPAKSKLGTDTGGRPMFKV